MKNISLKLSEEVYQETQGVLEWLEQSRNSYINEALAFYNAYQKRRRIEQQLAEESKLVREDSMAVLHEFESLEDEL
ncbi:MAG: hypothetical protein J5I98_36080 [Phaeodactylibacter sp.]|nr:hypothetical protein [Phaeodactylibacter sp.]